MQGNQNQTKPIYAAENYKREIWFRPAKWVELFESSPFAAFQDALRYFAEFPPTWGK